MPVPTARTDLSTTASSNSPSGSDTIGASTGPDDYLRAHASLIKLNYDDILLMAPIASPTFTGTLTGPTGAITSGTYTPTLAIVANAYGLAASVCQYMRVGNVVTVSGKVTGNNTDATTSTITLTLPVASTFTADAQVAGVGHLVQPGAAASNGAAKFFSANGGTVARAEWQATAAGQTFELYFTFTYQVL